MDVASGTFETYIEVKVENGSYDGYLKPFVRNADFKSAQDANDSLWEKVKEGAADLAESVLQNDKTEKAAASIPFSGKLKDPDVDVWTAIDTLLRNAFIQALKAGFNRG